jgi:hypothetical protein
MTERTFLINKLIKDNGYLSYLEIGYQWGLNFDNVICDKKVSVDPEVKFNADFTMSSDQFFEINKDKFDIVFIDGMHLREYVLRDVYNSLSILNENGVIVIHDCIPTHEHNQFRERISRNWQGDVWKAIVQLAQDGHLMQLLNVETGIVLLWNLKKEYHIPEGELTWQWLNDNFKQIF